MSNSETIQTLVEQINSTTNMFIAIIGIGIAILGIIQWKLSDSQLENIKNETIERIDNKYQKYTKKLKDIAIVHEGWTTNSGKENYAEITSYANLRFYSFDVVIKKDKVTDDFDIIMNTPTSLDISAGPYPAYYGEEDRWVAIWVDGKGQWSTSSLTKGKSATLYMNLSGQMDK